MAEMTLRAYVKEIDDLVEHEKLDEAIAHCRHVLETYPKHVDTYRLLGKTYLEAKRYGDAADLFQRVLSAIPDDFVAHIGMSIVREDEGNLDASIWHMERAFETNPANPAIQQELRRLIGKRDGLEPHKVRLTRGALARMYAHGELYPQAIAELRSALQEDPDRPDLQVLLANLHWRTDQKDQADDVARQILERLPFCRDANRIAAGFLQGAGRTDEATPSHRRLAALDPYAAFVETAMVDPNTVDAGSVQMQKLEWRPGHPVAAPDLPRPSWTDSLGAGLRADTERADAPEGPLPTWLAPNATAPAPASAAPQSLAPAPVEESPATIQPFAGGKAPPAEIPTWMQEAGWGESKGEAPEGPVSFTDSELAGVSPPAGEGELAPAEMPDWLRSIAAQQIGDEGAGPALGAEPDWLGEAAAEAPEQPPEPQAAPPPPAPRPTAGGEQLEVPTWLEEQSPGATETIVTWLGDRSAREAASQPPSEPAPAPATDQPDWLAQGDFFKDEEAAEAAPTAPEEPPAWLTGVAQAAEAAPTAPEEPPAWLTGVAEAAASERPVAAEPPSWVTHEIPEPVEEEIAPEPQSAAEAPDWLKAIAEPGTTPSPSPQAEADWLAGLSSAAASKPKAADAAGPEWLRGIGEPEEQAAPRPEAGTAPEWLKGLSGSMPPAAPAGPAPAGPDWLRDTSTPKAPGTAASALGAAGAGIDWLSGIAEPEEVPHAQEAAPLPPEAASIASENDLLRGLVEVGSQAEAGQPDLPSEANGDTWSTGEAAEAAPGPVETPEWLGRLAAAGPPPELPSAVAPSWLDAVAAEGEPEGAQEPDWAKQMPDISSAPPSRASVPATDDWLKGLLDEAPLPEEPARPEEAGEPDWFAPKAAAGRMGLDEGLNIPTATTGWLREVGEETLPPDALGPPSAPDWLKEFEAAGGPVASASDQTVIGSRGREPGQGTTGPQAPIGAMDASSAGELGEDDVQKWLEALASRQEVGSGGGIEEAPPPESTSFFPAAAPAEEVAPPDEAGEGMEWLEHLAGQVEPKPEPAAASWQPVDSTPVTPRLQVEPAAEPEDEEVPDWLRSLAAEGESVQSADAEAAAEEQAPDWLLTAAPSTLTGRPSVHTPEPPVPPEPPGIVEEVEDEGPDWLRIPAAVDGPPFEPQPSAETAREIDETPDWLLTAADAAEAAQPTETYAEAESEGMPDWLSQAAEPPDVVEALATAGADVEIPQAPTPPAPPEPEAVPEPPKPAPVAAPEPTWMRPSEPADVRPVPAETEIVVPEWLRVPVEGPAPPERAPQPVGQESVVAQVPPTAVPPVPEPAATAPPPVTLAAAPAEPVRPTPAQTAAVPSTAAPAPVAMETPAPEPAATAAPPVAPPAAPAEPVPPMPAEAAAIPSTAAPAPAAEEPPALPRPAKARTTARTALESLAAARQAVASNNLEAAAKHYGALIRRRSLLEDVMVDLKVAIDRLPDSPELWQVLGDAYMKADRAAEAVEAYRHSLANL